MTIFFSSFIWWLLIPQLYFYHIIFYQMWNTLLNIYQYFHKINDSGHLKNLEFSFKQESNYTSYSSQILYATLVSPGHITLTTANNQNAASQTRQCGKSTFFVKYHSRGIPKKLNNLQLWYTLLTWETRGPPDPCVAYFILFCYFHNMMCWRTWIDIS